MGLFRKRPEGYEPPAASAATCGIDFAAYDLAGLAGDVRSIVSIPGAIAQAAKYALTIPVIVAIVAWLVFSSRMAGWVLVPFTFVTLWLAFLGSLVLGGYFVVRTRLDTVERASARVVAVMGVMHADLAEVRDTKPEISVHQVAVALLDDAVFPVVFGALGDGVVARTVSKAPMKLVRQTVVAAVGALPDRRLGDLVDGAMSSMAGITERLAALAAHYDGIQRNLASTVQRVSTSALGSVLGLAIVAWIPLIIWLILGAILS